jgi:hypothetical protein
MRIRLPCFLATKAQLQYIAADILQPIFCLVRCNQDLNNPGGLSVPAQFRDRRERDTEVLSDFDAGGIRSPSRFFSRRRPGGVLMVVRIIPVKNRLRALLYAPGGVSRDDALSAARQNVETLRREFVGAIPLEIAALEAMLDVAGKKYVTKDELDAMLLRAGQLLTLSGTFGFDLLDQVVKRFCDLAMGMIEKDIDKAAPVAVHLRAMRLVCPGSVQLNAEDADNMLKSLERVHAHLGIKRLDGSAPKQA